ncbi:DUF262 domain-containing protein [Rhodocyclus tenuis]|uniref:DUF262 domain-containing protein n=1 Tax=Rhodocyclus gracilis TaxID=2929842 RepID=UPI001298B4B3|nr:DUF262 domain-containing protein [Rhodocyclus gracilis]MRD71645.1 DUF262 domain-containing protein [Rhodocyclus gracilis]
MQTELFTVSKIFTESLYRIPDYQRGYSWGADQLRDFWLDLEQLSKDGKHYTGVLTLEVVPKTKWRKWDDDCWIIESRRYKPYYVVDGQQRLTTVIILLQAILEICQLDGLNFTPITDVRRKYIYDSKLGSVERAYIFGYEKDNPSYEFLKTRIFLEESDVHLPDEVTIYTKQLIAAKEFFKERLKKFDASELETLFTKATQQLVFNVYEISTDIDVFVTFETMNNRGKPLSTLELLKNRLIFLSTKLPKSASRDGVLRRKINDAWKSAYHYLGKNDERQLDDDEFLQTQFAYFFLTNLAGEKNIDNKDIDFFYRRFLVSLDNYNRYLLNYLFTPKRIGNQNPNGEELPPLTADFIELFSQHMKSSVELYFKLSTPAQSDWSDRERLALERIGRLRGYRPAPILLALFRQERSPDKRSRVLEQYEKLSFFNSFGIRSQALYTRRNYASEPFVLYSRGKLSTDEISAYFENSINELFKETPLHEHLSDWIKNGHGYYGWHSIKYFLYEYELHLQQKSKSNREKISWKEFSKENYHDDFESIEHIYPQKARDPYWTQRFSGYNTTQRRLLRNSLGNLLPLAKPRNSSLGNKSFPEKIGNDSNFTGYRYGSYSEIEVSNYSEWGPEQILERGIHLLTFLEKHWSLPTTDNQQKARALGLSFMLKK